MIVAKLENLAGQMAPTSPLLQALNFLERLLQGAELPDGKVEIDGENVFAFLQSYQTTTPGETIVCEAHRKYIDVQYVVAGEEFIAWAPIEDLAVTKAYDEAGDAWLGTVPASGCTFVRLEAGQLALLYPTDGHAPRLATGAPAPVKKIVVKVAVTG
jgi:biofilm protein TabA